jgi:predicted acyl esterase
VDDQREASGRPDVLAAFSDVFTPPLKIGDRPIANLIACTSGTSSDWIVKLIDVYPDEVAGDPGMGGLSTLGRHFPRPLPRKSRRGQTAPLQSASLSRANHVFLKGHRILVNQSNWFRL